MLSFNQVILLCSFTCSGALRLGNGTKPEYVPGFESDAAAFTFFGDGQEFQHVEACDVGKEVIKEFSLSPPNLSSLPEVEALMQNSDDACRGALPPSSVSAWNSSGEEWKRWLYDPLVKELQLTREEVPALLQTSTHPESVDGSVVVVVLNGGKRIASWMSKDGVGGAGLNPLTACPLVKEVHLTWWPKDAPPVPFGTYEKDNKPVYVQDVSANLFVERYDIRKLGLYDNTGEFFLSLDDDKSFNCNDLHKMVAAGRRAPTHIVTPHGNCRTMNYDAHSVPRITYGIGGGNLALPSMALLSMTMMRGYTDTILPRVKPMTDLISTLVNGEDFLLNYGVAAMSTDGRAEECISAGYIKLSSGGTGIFCAPTPPHVDHEVWSHRRDAVLNIVARAFPVCTGFRGVSFQHGSTKKKAPAKAAAEAPVEIDKNDVQNGGWPQAGGWQAVPPPACVWPFCWGFTR